MRLKLCKITILTALVLIVGACTDTSTDNTVNVQKPIVNDKSTSQNTNKKESMTTLQNPEQGQVTDPSPMATVETEQQQAGATMHAPTEATENSSAASPMLQLAKRSGCLACHHIDKKVVGPAWKDVAKRYAGTPDSRQQLLEKVSKGGRGNWTEVVGNMAMPPYAPRVAQADIEKLVDFILTLK